MGNERVYQIAPSVRIAIMMARSNGFIDPPRHVAINEDAPLTGAFPFGFVFCETVSELGFARSQTSMRDTPTIRGPTL